MSTAGGYLTRQGVRDMKKNGSKISLARQRPERSASRHLSMGNTVVAKFSIAPADKKFLETEAFKRNYSFSLYINLILRGQEKSPLVK